MSTVLSKGAKMALLDLIKYRAAISLEVATEELKLAKTTVRQHLLMMEKQGLVTRRYERERERARQGRPKVFFELAQRGQRLYPTQEPALLRELLEFLESTGEQGKIKLFFERYWKKRREQFKTILGSLPSKKTNLEMRMKALHTLLESEGFMPQIERTGSLITVRECHCPFPEAIRATKLPCKLESDFIKWALKTVIKRTGYIPIGDSACVYSGKAK